jgi:histidine phosphotransferase ChpT
MQKLPELSGMDLAALLCSRVCHDVISPVGAIANGIELLDEGADEETSEIAMDLIRSSAKNASARLQYARIAFGAAGSAGAHNEKKSDIEWHGERALMAKNQVKLLLNLVLIGLSAIPRGGLVKVEIEDPNGSPTFRVTSTGMKGRVPPVFLDLLNGTFEENLDAHAIQPVYTLQLAESANMETTARLEGENVVFEAKVASV